MCLPCCVQRATAAAAPYSMSSGWATTASARSQSSGNVSRSAMARVCQAISGPSMGVAGRDVSGRRRSGSLGSFEDDDRRVGRA